MAEAGSGSIGPPGAEELQWCGRLCVVIGLPGCLALCPLFLGFPFSIVLYLCLAVLTKIRVAYVFNRTEGFRDVALA
jgi:hypothetical protein